MGGLGHAEGLDHGGIEDFFHASHYLRWQRRGGGTDKAQGGVRNDFPVMIRRFQDRHMHGGYGREPGGTAFLQPDEKFFPTETRAADHASASYQRCHYRGHQAVYVEQRHDVQTDIFTGQRQCGGDIARGGADIALGEGHKLGARGGA